ncbi:MAG TPA: DUF3460 family protein [Burkholderiaceae bacterium]|nr:DUF3460 family protein [Burkholderiaceae bacterium]
MYESDITKFLKEFKQRHPETETRQKEGRALLWDKQLDADDLAAWRAARVPQKGYVYSTGE